MATIQSGREILSLFTSDTKTQALTKKSGNSELLKTLVSAFFIVLIAAFVLGLAQRSLLGSRSAVPTITDHQESVAYIPGQFVSSKISDGYLGR